MAEESKIMTTIKCQNIAPLENLDKEIQSNSLKIAIFANNGSGKTFISRLFRLTEKKSELQLGDDRISPTDKLLSFGKNNGTFSFKVTDKEGVIKENISISLQEKYLPTIPDTNYLYHTFNQDYVEENIRALNYEKDSDVQGFILGKTQIDLTDDENKLSELEKQGKELKEQVEKDINGFVSKKVDIYTNIKRLNEYKFLNFQEILKNIDNDKSEVSKSLEELLEDYNKIKSVPENLEDIQVLKMIDFDFSMITTIRENLLKKYSLSSFAEDFKQKIKSKQSFIEKGVELFKQHNAVCPFCEQKINLDATNLIDNYTKYLSDTEAQTIKSFQGSLESMGYLLKIIKSLENDNVKRINSFNDYKAKYIPACESVELENINSELLNNLLQSVIEKIKQKLENIAIVVELEDALVENIEMQKKLLNRIVDDNNDKINDINSRKNGISEENKSIRKEICKSAYNHLVETYTINIKTIIRLGNESLILKTEISKKKEAEKVSKKSKVASTIKAILNYFFSDKYTLDEENFRLVFNKTTLQKEQAKNVLSEGEKNIIAFAYYIGDTHLKVESENDYKKIFFIIDDPISSMDFTYVYTLCGVIRDIKKIIDKLDRERFIIFTHNNDFMRIIVSNNIADKSLLLQNGSIKEFNQNLTVPYISHLLDIYRIARKEGTVNHTTANSIRHIIETLTKFQNIEVSDNSIKAYIEDKFPKDKKSYTLINDLSHGGWRSDQSPITEEEYKEVCEAIIQHIEKDFQKQIEYCSKN